MSENEKGTSKAAKVKPKSVRMRCSVCGANVYDDGTQDCDCDAHDYGRYYSGASE